MSYRGFYLGLFIVIANIYLATSQQLPQFSQYIYNNIIYNPAFAGSRESMVINVLNRNQWVGVNGAPVTQTLSAHTLLPDYKVGLGVSFINDRIGFEKNIHAYIDFSYTITLGSFDEHKIAFGVKAGFSKYSLDNMLLGNPEYFNDSFLQQIDFRFKPNIGAGIYFRGNNYYIGLGVPRLFTDRNQEGFVDLQRISSFLSGGYIVDFNKNLKFKPSFMVKYTDGAPISIDLTSMFYVNEILWLGASYRLNDSVGALANLKITEGLSFGYSYDFVTSDLSPYTSGSHEILLNYEFEFPKPRCKCKKLYN